MVASSVSAIAAEPSGLVLAQHRCWAGQRRSLANSDEIEDRLESRWLWMADELRHPGRATGCDCTMTIRQAGDAGQKPDRARQPARAEWPLIARRPRSSARTLARNLVVCMDVLPEWPSRRSTRESRRPYALVALARQWFGSSPAIGVGIISLPLNARLDQPPHARPD